VKLDFAPHIAVLLSIIIILLYSSAAVGGR
jgi:hypothetical protein